MVKEPVAAEKAAQQPSEEDNETETETEAENEEGQDEEELKGQKDSAQAKRTLRALQSSDAVKSSMGNSGDRDTLYFLNTKTPFEEKAERRKKVLAIMKVNPTDVVAVAEAFDIDEATAKRHLQERAGDLERTVAFLTALA